MRGLDICCNLVAFWYNVQHVQRPVLSFGPKASMQLITCPVNVCKVMSFSLEYVLLLPVRKPRGFVLPLNLLNSASCFLQFLLQELRLSSNLISDFDVESSMMITDGSLSTTWLKNLHQVVHQ